MGVSSPADFSRVDELRQPNAHTERAPRVFGISPAKCRWALSTARRPPYSRSEEHTSELQSRPHLVCRLLLEKKKKRDHIASMPEVVIEQIGAPIDVYTKPYAQFVGLFIWSHPTNCHVGERLHAVVASVRCTV